MDQVLATCNDGLRYPRNLSLRDYPDHLLRSYFQRLNDNHDRMFSTEEDSELNFRDLDNDGESPLAALLPSSLR